MGYRDDIQIDRYNLTEELLKQPQIYMTWALKSAKCEDKISWKKDQLEVAKAKAEKLIRSNPSKYGIEDAKEGAIKAEIKLHPKVRKATRELLEHAKDNRVYAAVKKSFEQRKKMLEKMVDLNIQLHFADVKVGDFRPKGSAQKEEERSERKKLSKRLKKSFKSKAKKRKKLHRR